MQRLKGKIAIVTGASRGGGRGIALLSEYWQLLWHYLKPQRCAVLLMAVLLLASIGLQLVGPQVARAFIDAARAGASVGVLIRAALLFIVVSIVQQGMNALATYWSERVAWTATNDLRADLAAHLLRLDLGFHKARTPGEFIERVDGDVNVLAGFFSSFVVRLVGSGLLLIGVLVAVYLVDWRLGLAFTGFAALTLALLSWVKRFATPYWRQGRERSAAFYGYLGEALTATEDIRSCGAVEYAMLRFFEHLRNCMSIGWRAGFWGQSVWAVRHRCLCHWGWYRLRAGRRLVPDRSHFTRHGIHDCGLRSNVGATH